MCRTSRDDRRSASRYDQGDANSYASNDYPEQAVTVPVPPGTPGWADVVLTTSNVRHAETGNAVLKKEAQVTGGQLRVRSVRCGARRLLSNGSGNNVAVFNPNAQHLGRRFSPLRSARSRCCKN